jgi:hypothetical protein
MTRKMLDRNAKPQTRVGYFIGPPEKTTIEEVSLGPRWDEPRTLSGNLPIRNLDPNN